RHGPHDVLRERAVDVDAHPLYVRPQVRARRVGRVLDVVDRHLVAWGDRVDAVADEVDDTRRLVARDHGQLVGAEAALLEKQVRAADAARLDPHARLAGTGLRVGPLDELERCADGGQERSPHTSLLSIPRKRAQMPAASAKAPGVADEWWFAPARHQSSQPSSPRWKRNPAFAVPGDANSRPVNEPAGAISR